MKKNINKVTKVAPVSAEKERNIRPKLLIDLLKRRGISDEQLENIEKVDDIRVVLLSIYPGYKFKVKSGKYLVGQNAALYKIKEQKLTVLSSGLTYVYMLMRKDKVEEVINDLRTIGRVCVYKWYPSITKIESAKKPSNNSSKVAAAARKRRKLKSAENFKNRKKVNKTKKLKKKYTPHKNITNVEKRRQKRAKRIALATIRKEQNKSLALKQMALRREKDNALNKKYPKEQELNLNAA